MRPLSHPPPPVVRQGNKHPPYKWADTSVDTSGDIHAYGEYFNPTCFAAACNKQLFLTTPGQVSTDTRNNKRSIVV